MNVRADWMSLVDVSSALEQIHSQASDLKLGSAAQGGMK